MPDAANQPTGRRSMARPDHDVWMAAYRRSRRNSTYHEIATTNDRTWCNRWFGAVVDHQPVRGVILTEQEAQDMDVSLCGVCRSASGKEPT